MCRDVIFCRKSAQVFVTPSIWHVFSAAQSSRIFLDPRRLKVWIMPPRHPQISNHIAKSIWKAAPNLLKPFGRKIFEVLLNLNNYHFKYKSTKLKSCFGEVSDTHRFFRVLGPFRPKALFDHFPKGNNVWVLGPHRHVGCILCGSSSSVIPRYLRNPLWGGWTIVFLGCSTPSLPGLLVVLD